MHYVIGSGPSGIAAAAALLDRGVAVTMLDVGRTVETERHAIVERMSAREPEDWSPGDRAAIRSRVDAGDRSLPLKTVYGSTFPYAMDALRSIQQVGTNCLQSFAKGGLSNVWGAAVLPNVARDMADWPVSVDDLAPHYQQVARLLPVAAASDELAAQFPVHGATSAPLRPSRQAHALLTHMRRHPAGAGVGRDCLRAVAARSQELGLTTKIGNVSIHGTVLVGLSVGRIWNAAEALDALRTRAHFSYRPGLLVERVESLPGGGRCVSTHRRRLGASRLRGRRSLPRVRARVDDPDRESTHCAPTTNRSGCSSSRVCSFP
jgi:choline dehydrogenase-like flavoprotein